MMYAALVTAMVAGRLVWGAVRFVLAGLTGSSFPFSAFLSGALLTAVPGILAQLVLIPLILTALEKAGFMTKAFSGKRISDNFCRNTYRSSHCSQVPIPGYYMRSVRYLSSQRPAAHRSSGFPAQCGSGYDCSGSGIHKGPD